MRAAGIEVRTGADGSVIVCVRGQVGPAHAVELRQVLVHTIRRVRPTRMVLDFSGLAELDAINLGTVVASCGLGDDHAVAVFVDHSPAAVADQLTAAGMAPQRLRHTCVPR
jgi:anti-sigma B factor antagonist